MLPRYRIALYIYDKQEYARSNFTNILKFHSMVRNVILLMAPETQSKVGIAIVAIVAMSILFMTVWASIKISNHKVKKQKT